MHDKPSLRTTGVLKAAGGLNGPAGRGATGGRTEEAHLQGPGRVDSAVGLKSAGRLKSAPGIKSAAGLRVRFLDGARGGLSVLEIEVPRSQRTLGDVHQVLLGMGIELSHVEVHVGPDSVIERLTLSERGGSPISLGRHLEIQTHVLELVQTRLWENASSAPSMLAQAP